MIIDFSKMSPMQRIRVMDAIHSVAARELNEITTDLQYYDQESSAFAEMTGWSEGCREVKQKSHQIKMESLKLHG